jgi:putative ABC transport system permease protein
MAGVLAAPVAQTVTALYLPVDSHGGWPTLGEMVAGIAAGIGASVVAAWIPARQAASVDPTRVLHPGAAPEIFPMPSRRLALVGACLLLVAWLVSWWTLEGGPALLGFVAAFLVLAGFSLMVPLATQAAAAVVFSLKQNRLFSGGVLLQIAVEQARRSLHRTAPTIAALAAAAAMTVGISVMIHSFRGSVVAWAERTLTADLFLAPASNELLGLTHTLPETEAAWWAARPDVAAVGTFREYESRTSDGEPVTLGVVSGPARGSIDFMHGDGERKTRLLMTGEGVALSESLGRRLHLGPGNLLSLVGPNGPVTLPVLDLYRDYTRDRGIAMIGTPCFERVWGVKGVHSLAIKFRDGTTPAQMERAQAEFFTTFGGKEAFVAYGNRTLKARIIEIFNQTFAVTAVLKTISIVVAVGGVMLTLGILVLERARDLGVLRSMGASTGQVVRIMLSEAALIGLIASMVGILSGCALSLVLTWVINEAFFGWSIDLAFPVGEILLLPFWMTGAAMIAGILPSLRAARISPAAALRME